MENIEILLKICSKCDKCIKADEKPVQCNFDPTSIKNIIDLIDSTGCPKKIFSPGGLPSVPPEMSHYSGYSGTYRNVINIEKKKIV